MSRSRKKTDPKAPPPIIQSFNISNGESIHWVPSALLNRNVWALYGADGAIIRHLMYYENEAINGVLEALNGLQKPVSIS